MSYPPEEVILAYIEEVEEQITHWFSKHEAWNCSKSLLESWLKYTVPELQQEY